MKWSQNTIPNTTADLIARGYTKYQAEHLARIGITAATVDDFINPSLRTMAEPPDNLPEAISIVKKAIKNKEHITIFGDYDVDGITSSYILKSALKAVGGDVKVILPNRFDGYGISVEDIDEIEPGLLITVDNGIAAIDAIQAAKDKGLKVIVLDHHLPGETLPNADVIVDLHMPGTKYPFKEFCAAGLALKFVQGLGVANEELMTIAAIGTIADMVPLLDENRFIVKQGLHFLNEALANNSKKINFGLAMLFTQMNKQVVDTNDVAFTIAPMFNASGRMLAHGAELGFKLLDAENPIEAEALVNQLLEANTNRKLATEQGMDIAIQQIDDLCLYGDGVLIIYDERLNEGIVGLIAGRLVEKFNVPTIVLTKSIEDGIVKGSGRSVDSVDLFEMVSKVKDMLVKFGGHKAAIGLSLKEEDVEELRIKLNDIASEMGFSPETVVMPYDFELKAKDVQQFTDEMSLLAPFGMGNPEPVVVVTDFLATPNGSTHYKLLGEGEKHVKLYGEHFDALFFSLYPEYRKSGFPRGLKIIGNTGYSYFNGKRLQMTVRDFVPAPSVKPTSKLQEALKKAICDNI